MPVYPAYEFAFSAYQAYEENFRAQAKSALAEAEKWANDAKKRGIEVAIEVDSKRGGSVAEAVVKLATRLKAIVALAAQSRPLRALLMGSATRQIVRNSTQPVWVIHPSAQARSLRRNQTWSPPLFVIKPEENVEGVKIA
jgi:nucleotide-binding universal stress UspA family protein